MTEARFARALIVEEDQVTAALVHRALTRAGYRILHTRDQVQAAALLDAQTHDVVIFSLNLPNAAGLQIIRQARHHHGGLGIVVLNGGKGQLRSFTPAVVQMFEAIGVDVVLKKPFCARELMIAVSSAIASRSSVISRKQAQ